MPLNPLDLDRLAVRIETLTQTRTHGWLPGDDLEFKRGLPNPQVLRGVLPSVETVRAAAKGAAEFSPVEYRNALQVCLRLEDIISRNRPNNPRRMMHDMARGRVPFSR